MCRRKSLHAAAGDLATAPTPRRSEAVDKLIQQWETSSPRSTQPPTFFSPIRTSSPRTPPSASGLHAPEECFALPMNEIKLLVSGRLLVTSSIACLSIEITQCSLCKSRRHVAAPVALMAPSFMLTCFLIGYASHRQDCPLMVCCSALICLSKSMCDAEIHVDRQGLWPPGGHLPVQL